MVNAAAECDPTERQGSSVRKAAATTAQLKTLTKEDFQNCFRKWQERWDKYVRSEGD